MKDKIISFLMKRMRVEVGVAGIVKKGQKVFLTKRAKVLVDGGKWCLPGGHVEKWERAVVALKREIKEETGFDVKKAKLLFVHEEFVKRLNLHAVVFVYQIDVEGNENKNWEVSESDWFSKSEIGKLNLAFTHGEILEKFFGGGK